MIENRTNKKIRDLKYEIPAIVILITEFVYVIIRAFLIPITYDETGTYIVNVRDQSLLEIIINPNINVNNHLLNTFLVKIFVIFFGNSEFVLRIPALIGGFLFLFFTYKISKILYNKMSILISILFITLNPILLIYLALSRGYSLGLGFLMVSLYYLFKTIKNIGKKKNNNSFCILSLFLATLAITTFIYVLFTLTIFLIIFEVTNLIRNNRSSYEDLSLFKKIGFIFKMSKKNLIIPLLINYIPLGSYILYFILKIHAFNKGYWGTKTFMRSLESLMSFFVCKNGFLFLNENTLSMLLWVLICVSICIVIIVLTHFGIQCLKRNEIKMSIEREYVIMFSFLLFVSISMQLLHFLAHTIFYDTFIFDIVKNIFLNELERLNFRFVADRSGFFIFPLFSLFIVSLGHFLQSEFLVNFRHFLHKKKWKKNRINQLFNLSKGSIYFYFSFFFSLLLLNTINNVSLNSLHYWNYDNSNREIAQDLIDLHSQYYEPTETMHLYVDIFLEGGVYYYKILYKMDWLDISVSHWAKMNLNYDYYLFYNTTDVINQYNLKVVKYYEISDVYLAEV